MPSAITLKTLGNWTKDVEVPLERVIGVSMDVTGRTGEDACRHALILMAQSASARTKQSKKLRPIVRNPSDKWKTDRRYAPWGVNIYKDGQKTFLPIYRSGEFGKIRFFDKNSMSWFDRYGPKGNQWRKVASGPDQVNPEIAVPGIKSDKRRKIGRRGLAKSSWGWALPAIGGRSKGPQRAIQGVALVSTIKSPMLNGYVLTNRLRYILKIMKPGWEMAVQMAANNKIMEQARQKLENRWRKDMMMPNRGKREKKASAAELAQYFQRVG